MNDDGILDYTILPQPLVVPLSVDDDLVIFIPIRSKVTGFTLLSQPGDSRLLQPLTANQLPAGAWQIAQLAFAYADVTGSGCNALVVRGMASGTAPGRTDTAVVRYGVSGVPSSAQVLATSADGYGLGDGEITGLDKTGDGRQDLVHVIGGVIQGVYIADPQGTVTYDNDATIMAVWNDFVTAAIARDGRALSYLGLGVIQRYGAELTTDSLQAMSKGIKFAGIQYSDNKLASVVVQRSSPAGDVLYTVLLLKVGYDSWRITGL